MTRPTVAAELAFVPELSSLPTLHNLGLFHTTTTRSRSSCAYTQKVLKFPRMMQPFGYRVVHYGNGDDESGADEHVQLLTYSQLQHHKGAWIEACIRVQEKGALKGDHLHRARCIEAEKLATSGETFHHNQVFEGDTAALGSPHHTRFETKLREELNKRLKPGDIVLHPFGRTHASLVPRLADGNPDCSRHIHVELGLGYGDRPFGAFRIFESYAWMHYHQGQDGRQGHAYECVIPNYFVSEEWPMVMEPKHDHLVYFGRITPLKGLDIVAEMAKRGHKIVAVGQGVPEQRWIDAGIEFRAPITGLERAELLGNCRAVLLPTRYTEPFGGTVVEAQFCGTPCITCDYGAMTETIEHGKTGFRCHVLGDYLGAAEKIRSLSRPYIAMRARSIWSTEAIGRRYDAFFRQVRGLVSFDPETDPLRDWGRTDALWLNLPEVH